MFGTLTCVLLGEVLLKVHGENEGGSDGNAKANGNVLSGTSVGLPSQLPLRNVDRGCCDNIGAVATVLLNKRNNCFGRGEEVSKSKSEERGLC